MPKRLWMIKLISLRKKKHLRVDRAFKRIKQKNIGVKWVYKKKLKKNSEIDKYKTCLSAKNYK